MAGMPSAQLRAQGLAALGSSPEALAELQSALQSAAPPPLVRLRCPGRAGREALWLAVRASPLPLPAPFPHAPPAGSRHCLLMLEDISDQVAQVCAGSQLLKGFPRVII